MEFSSPLAAIRPQPCLSWGGRKDLPVSHAPFNGGFSTYGPNSFDFKTMSMHRESNRAPNRDYFTVKPLRHSSPTSSLTADLDANFHIDKSPQAPTPRRSLFTADLFKPREDTLRLPALSARHGDVTTPPVVTPSSPGIDLMDASPLPHKAPFFVAQLTLPSPTPEATSTSSEDPTPGLLSPLDAESTFSSAVQSPTFFPFPERRRPATRPALTRSKGYSAGPIAVPPRPSSAENALPPFRFGSILSNELSSSSTPNLLSERFTESPIDEVKPTLSAIMAPSRKHALAPANRSMGPPMGGHVRKPSGGRQPFVRPQRKLIRRSLSMFQHPDDIMREEQDAFEPQPNLASSVMDVDQDHSPKLPHFIPDDEPDSLPRISQDTMADVLDNKYSAQYDRVMVVDCRFEYEYNGGHIENAVNFNDKQHLASQLFADQSISSTTLLILHCEYSVHRAPLTAKFIRNHDRNVNAANYPRLTYPEMYILDGGYSKFFATHRSKCYPQNYVEMNDQRHEQACERGMAKVKQRQKLFRHQTFAFGDTHDAVDSSPTAQTRGGLGPRSQSLFAVGADIGEGIGMSYQRRMASY